MDEKRRIEQDTSEIERTCNLAGGKGFRMGKSSGEDFTVLGFSENTVSVNPNDLQASP